MPATERAAVADIVAKTLAELREDLQLPALPEIDDDTPLYGSGSDLDSMALVHLIADLESRLQARFGKDWILADDRALSRNRSPYRSVGDLVRYILETEPQ